MSKSQRVAEWALEPEVAAQVALQAQVAELRAEVERLRAVETAAKSVVAAEAEYGTTWLHKRQVAVDALRAVLEATK